MKQISKAIFLLLPLMALNALSGCRELQIKDGVIPSEFLDSAKKIVGTYEGITHIRSSETSYPHPNDPLREIELNFKLENNKLIVSTDSDLAGKWCNSEIGALYSVVLDDHDQIIGAIYKFDPGDCLDKVKGRFLDISFNNKYNMSSIQVYYDDYEIDHKTWKQSDRYYIRGDLSRIEKKTEKK